MTQRRELPREMQISNAELLRMTRELDDMHHDAMPRFHDALRGLTESVREELAGVRRAARLQATRRNFLRGGLVSAGALGGGVLVAACGSSSSSSTSPAATPSPDLKLMALAASLEVLAVGTYTTASAAAGQGKFGPVPAAFGAFAQTVTGQHKDHQDAWNASLTGAGQPAVTTPNKKYNAVVAQQLPGVTTIPQVAMLATTLETIAVETYVSMAGALADKRNRSVALTIAPVEAQHIAILTFVLGKYPVPASTIATDQAATVDSLNG